jgi:hypothetical protein
MTRCRRWLGLAAAGGFVAATGLVTWQAWPLIVIYWEVGRLLPSLTFTFQVAAIAVNLALFAGFIALARAISRITPVRRWRRPRPSGLVISALIVALLVYLYPLARTGLLSASFPDAGPPITSFGRAARA